MSEFVWHWKKGDIKIYTKRTDVAERALKEGRLVFAYRVNPAVSQE
jgi:hypothetical protein